MGAGECVLVTGGLGFIGARRGPAAAGVRGEGGGGEGGGGRG